jgi:IS6 family transposase
MRDVKTSRSLRTVAAGHAFVQNLRRGHYEITLDVPVHPASGSPSTTSRVVSDRDRRAPSA